MNDTKTASAQVILALIYAVGFFATLFTLIFFAKDMGEFTKSIMLTMLGYLGALVQQQSSYFFARQRPDAPVADPDKSVITTESQIKTTTTPTTALTPPTPTEPLKEQP